MLVKHNSKLLLSARDMGAAQGIAQLFMESMSRGWTETKLIATGVAADFFESQGLSFTRVDWGTVEQAHAGARLLEKTEAFFKTECFDSIVVGLSGMGMGLDEALVSLADCPTYALQDYWGDINQGFGKTADVFLVLDELAANLTRQRGMSPERCHVVGSIKHADLNNTIIDLEKEIIISRKRLDLSEYDRVLLICGQPLWSYESYRDSLIMLIKSASRIPHLRIVYKPHPLEIDADIFSFAGHLKDVNDSFTIDGHTSLYTALAISDLNCSMFSSCGWDQIMLIRHLDRPLGTVAHLLADPGMRKVLFSMTGLETVPTCCTGLAREIGDYNNLEQVLIYLLRPEQKAEQFSKIKNQVKDPSRSAKFALDFVAENLLLNTSRANNNY